MVKRILLIYEPANQAPLVSNIVSLLRNKGIAIDAFNSYKWEFLDTDKEISFSYRLFRSLLFVHKIGTIIRRSIQTSLLLSVSKSYDLVDLHYFCRSFIPFLQRINKPYKVTIWGSDFYRESSVFQQQKRVLYERSLMIQVATEEVKQDVIAYDSKLSEKIVVCNFGIDFQPLDTADYVHPLVPKSDVNGRIIVTIGYNGSRGQQHTLLIHAVSALPEAYRDRIYLYIPVTYGLSSEYESELVSELSHTGIPFHLFKYRLTEDEMAQLRRESDIVLNAQVTDSLNASLLQHLYYGSIVIVGDWLPYGIYDRNDILYFKTDSDGFTLKLIDCLDHYSNLKAAVSSNADKVLRFASWESVSDKLYSMYKSLCSCS